MRVPSFEALEKQCADEGVSSSFARRMHPNPRLFKYVWWVFWRQSACDGQAFLVDRHALCTYAAMQLIEDLTSKGEKHWIYNRRIPRSDFGNSPVSPTMSKWNGVKFAPPFCDDSDPEWQGHR